MGVFLENFGSTCDVVVEVTRACVCIVLENICAFRVLFELELYRTSPLIVDASKRELLTTQQVLRQLCQGF